MRVLFVSLVMLVMASSAYGQTNPCTAPKPPLTIVTATSQVAATVTDYAALFGGVPVVAELDVAVFNKGVDPNQAGSVPVSSLPVARGQWSLRPGTTNCYSTPAPFLVTVSPNTEYDLFTRGRGPGGTGPWNSGGPVPFGRPGPPAAQTGLAIIP